ncbi:MAG: tRNA-dihydrouridine synthase [Alphaproteobacteria bacterium]|nr:tRNA-dihydrouridine synthase [Alphaproteobacteria bacterium]
MKFGITPITGITDRHFRFMVRLMSKETALYTEPVAAKDILQADLRDNVLCYSPEEHPLRLFLTGRNHKTIAEAAKIVEEYGYDGIHIKAFAPLERIGAGNFGVTIIPDAETTCRCIDAARQAVKIPLSVDIAISLVGEDFNKEDALKLKRLIRMVSSAGTDDFVINITRNHARKEKVKLSKAEKTRHDMVYRLQEEYPHLKFTTYGDVKTFPNALEHLTKTDGVLIGYSVHSNPYMMIDADKTIFGKDGPNPSRTEIVESMIEYADRALKEGASIKTIVKHMMGIFNSCEGSRMWKYMLVEGCSFEDAGSEVLVMALNKLEDKECPYL